MSTTLLYRSPLSLPTDLRINIHDSMFRKYACQCGRVTINTDSLSWRSSCTEYYGMMPVIPWHNHESGRKRGSISMGYKLDGANRTDKRLTVSVPWTNFVIIFIQVVSKNPHTSKIRQLYVLTPCFTQLRIFSPWLTLPISKHYKRSINEHHKCPQRHHPT